MELAKVIEWFDEVRQEENDDPSRSFFSLEHEGFGYLFGNGWGFDPKHPNHESYPRELEDVRAVFWFDN